jgi:hypothetical protein
MKKNGVWHICAKNVTRSNMFSKCYRNVYVKRLNDSSEEDLPVSGRWVGSAVEWIPHLLYGSFFKSFYPFKDFSCLIYQII